MRNPCLLLRQPLRLTVPFSCCRFISKASQPSIPRRTCRVFSLTAFRPVTPTMKASNVMYEPIEDVERMKHYRAGGYHPVMIGDRFHDRYRVVHKLGHGTYSTIWLARDEVSNRYVAVDFVRRIRNPWRTWCCPGCHNPSNRQA